MFRFENIVLVILLISGVYFILPDIHQSPNTLDWLLIVQIELSAQVLLSNYEKWKHKK
jgi:hypothetical protein